MSELVSDYLNQQAQPESEGFATIRKDDLDRLQQRILMLLTGVIPAIVVLQFIHDLVR